MRVSTCRPYHRASFTLVFLTLASIVTLLAACGSASTVRKPAATATPSPTATPQVLYQANWTDGASAWTLTPGWSITPAGLANNGQGAASVVIPYTPTVANYTVVITMAVNTVVWTDCGSTFGLEGRTEADAIVYDAIINSICPNLHGFASVYSSNSDGGFVTYDYTTGRSVRTYTINVNGPLVSYYYSTAFLGTVRCDKPTQPNKLTLVNAGVSTIISKIVITTP